jgi:hypothetical protein
MPVVGPPPAGYSGTVPSYYAAVATQTTVTPTLVEILPEQLVPQSGALEKKGLLVTITNPAASFPPPPVNPPLAIPPPPPSFGTLFAVMGGELVYRRATDPMGLNTLLPPPYSAIQTAVTYPAPAGTVTPAWGTLILQIWGTDLQALKGALKDKPPSSFVYYLGVDEASLAPLLKAALKEIYTEQIYLDQLAAESQKPAVKQRKPSVRAVVETIMLSPFQTGPVAPTPTYNQLIDDYFNAFLAGSTTILVKGGTPVGKAIEVSGPGFPGPTTVGQVELWFLDTSVPAEFISPIWILGGAPSYGF